MEERRSEEREHLTEEQMLVRQVTHVQASWAERERGQLSQQKFQTAISVGATILGALLGRKAGEKFKAETPAGEIEFKLKRVQ